MNVKTEIFNLSLTRQAADDGDPIAQFQMGEIYSEGKYLEEDDQQAAIWYRKAALQGNADAQFAMGALYHTGLHAFEENENEARNWYELAADQGNAHGQFMLGMMYLNGTSIKQDYEKSAMWLLKSAKQEVAQAQYQLGIMYVNGWGVEKNFERALIWLTKAGAQGLKEATEMASSLTSIEIGLESANKELAELEELMRTNLGRVCLAGTKEAPYLTIAQALDKDDSLEEWLASLPRKCDLLCQVTTPTQGGSDFIQVYQIWLQEHGYPTESDSFSSVPPKLALEVFLATRDTFENETLIDEDRDEDGEDGSNETSAKETRVDDLGYLYVLANSAMPGLVKVGKTTRTPSERAIELSGATGLPTPFIVVYEQLFQDCSAAESFVHIYLAQKCFRVSDNREFFSAPVNDVVRAITLAPDPIDSDSPKLMRGTEDDPLENDETEKAYPWSSIFDEAEHYYYGLEDYLQDYVEALRLYRQAAQLGSLPAYGKIGEIYNRGESVQQDQEKALEYYKEGARKGSIYCYWAMGVLFVNSKNQQNAEKCFLNFIKKFPSFTDEQHLTSSERTKIFIECGYLIKAKLRYGIKYPAVLDTFFNGERSVSILYHAKERGKYYRSHDALEMADDFAKVIQYLNSIQHLPQTDNPVTPDRERDVFAKLFP